MFVLALFLGIGGILLLTNAATTGQLGLVALATFVFGFLGGIGYLFIDGIFFECRSVFCDPAPDPDLATILTTSFAICFAAVTALTLWTEHDGRRRN